MLARALAVATARRAVGAGRLAEPAAAEVAGRALRVGRAGGETGRRAALVRAARDGRGCGARAGAVTIRRRRRGRAAARAGRADDRAPGGEATRGRARAVAHRLA